MKKNNYLKVVEFFEEALEFGFDDNELREELVPYYQELESTVFQKYVNKKHRMTNFEKPLANAYDFLTKSCRSCKELNAKLFNDDIIDDETLLLDFEKEEIQKLFDDNFTYLHCLLCDDHVPMDLVTTTKTYTCDVCRFKLNV